MAEIPNSAEVPEILNGVDKAPEATVNLKDIVAEDPIGDEDDEYDEEDEDAEEDRQIVGDEDDEEDEDDGDDYEDEEDRDAQSKSGGLTALLLGDPNAPDADDDDDEEEEDEEDYEPAPAPKIVAPPMAKKRSIQEVEEETDAPDPKKAKA